MTLQTEFAMSAGDGGINRHALTILQFASKFMSQDKRTFQLCVADRSPRKPMQIRAAHAHRLHSDKFLARPSDRDGFFMVS
jgi:hypothetical protein